MSVRVTERLIGDVVVVTGLPNSPLMVVQGIDEEAKMVDTTWFSDDHACQEGTFPASAIDRAEPRPKPAAKEKKPDGAAVRRGRKPAIKK